MGLALLLSALFTAGCVRSSVHQAALLELGETRGNLDRTREENTELKRQTAEQAAAIQDFQHQLGELRARGEIRSQDAERLAQRNIELASEIAALERQKTDLGQSIQSQTQQLNELQHRLEEASRSQQEAVDRLKSTYDTLVGELQDEIKKGEITITQVLDKLSVNLVEKILFDSGSAEVKSSGLKVLDRVAAILKNVKDKQIRIEGHTDNVPIGFRLTDRFPTNWELSAARATHVVRYLSEKGGISPGLLSAVGLADTRPVGPNDTPSGRSQNRRIEIVLLPLNMDRVLEELKPPPQTP